MSRRTLDTDQVVSAAAALADEEGLDAVTLTRVANQLGVRQPALYRHVDSYDALVRLLGLRGREILAERLAAADVPYAKIGDPATIHEDPQVLANDLLFEMDHPVAGHLRQARPLGDFDGTPTELRRGAPAIGEHTREIALEAGLTASEITALTQAGVLQEAAD